MLFNLARDVERGDIRAPALLPALALRRTFTLRVSRTAVRKSAFPPPRTAFLHRISTFP